MQKTLFFIPVLMLFLAGCAEKSYFIDGSSNVFSPSGGMAYIREFSASANRSIDSCEVVHGHFQMSGPIDSTVFASLYMGGNTYIPVVLETGDINVNIANTSVKIHGTPLNDKLYAFLAQRDSLVYLLSDLPRSQAYLFMQGLSPFEIQARLQQKQSEYINALDNLETQFIKDNYDNVLGTTWFMELCYRAQAANFGIPILLPGLKDIYEKAPKRFRKNYRVAAFINATHSY